jgi:hypothetical protein
MNLREEILKEHSKRQNLKIVKYVGNDQQRFDELVQLFLGSEYRITQRAAWAVSCCVEEHPDLIKKHLRKIILNLKNPVHDAVKRNTVRLLQYIKIPEQLEGIVAATCFDFLNSKDEPIAVKAFSMTVLSKICKTHPELAHELKLTIETMLPYASAGILSRAKRILKELEEIKEH